MSFEWKADEDEFGDDEDEDESTVGFVTQGNNKKSFFMTNWPDLELKNYILFNENCLVELSFQKFLECKFSQGQL